MDVLDLASIEAVVNSVGTNLNLLINNAAILHFESLENLILETVTKVCQTNVLTPLLICKAALNMASQCLSENLRQHQILYAAIHPSWVRTHMGGIKAPLIVTDSVCSMMKVLASLSQNDTGKYLDWAGKALPW